MLLTSQPVERAVDASRELDFELHVVRDRQVLTQRDQPPERRVYAAHVPEICILLFGRNEFRYLPVFGLIERERSQARARTLDERGIPRPNHSERTQPGVACENGMVILASGALARRSCKNAMLGQIRLEQSDRSLVTALNDLRPVLGVASRGF